MQGPRDSIIAIAATMSLLVGCEADRSDNDVDADEAAINVLIEEMTDAFEARNWESFAGFFADDGVWMPPGVAPLTGKNEWWTLVQPWWSKSTVLESSVLTEDLIVSGDWAIERHVDYQMTIFGDGAEPMPLHFKGIYILRRQEDGSWKIAQYIWNENIP